jgi:aryl-alcohol dehydrogenase-like predicted oxidoreductase
MNYRTLGRTGLVVSEIGFGAWGIGGSAAGDVAYGLTNDADSRAALEKAFELGVNFYDTSDLYGFGHSERLIGEVFSARRERVILASKVGFVRRDGDLAQDFSAAHIRRSLDASLQRLRTDYVDLYQLHSPPPDLLENGAEALDALQALQDEGKIRAIGISVRSPDDALVAVKRRAVGAVQVNFNLVDQRIARNGLMSLAQSEEVGIICRTPLSFGFLADGNSPRAEFGPNDHRSRWPVAQRELWADADQLFAGVLRGSGQTRAQRALRFCLSYPAISTVIPGMLLPDHVVENTQVSALGPFGGEERRQAEEIYDRHQFFLST